MHISNLAIKAWNIYGIFRNTNGFLYNKLHDQDFINHVKNFLIFGLIETHHTSDDIDKLQIFGYKCFQSCRKKLKFGRKHGGLAIYVHNSILPGVCKLPLAGSETIILKLKKDFFSFSNDIMLSFSYCAPAGSSFLSRTQFDPFADLEIKLANAAQEGDLVCFGDFNARTGTDLDYLNNEDNTGIPVPEDTYVTDTVATYPRGNLDVMTNQYGDQLISLCRSLPLRICNGRKLGDIMGDFTCYKWNGQSTVDYCLASPNIYSKIITFQVHNLIPHLSDHCSTSIAISTDIQLAFNPKNDCNLLEKPKKLSWSKQIQQNFENLIQSGEAKNFLSNFAINGVDPNQSSIDIATKLFTDFVIKSAIEADTVRPICYKCPPKSPKPNWKFKKRVKKPPKPKWFDTSCEEMRNKMRKTSDLLKKFPKHPYLLRCLQVEQKQYKKLLKKKHKEFLNQMFSELDQIHNQNPRGYMNLVKSMRDGSFDKQIPDNSSFVSPKDWRHHFTELLGPTVPLTPSEIDMARFVTENSDKYKTELDIPISRSEIIEEISKLDNNKAISFDRVSNEILKTGKLVFAKPLLNLFNPILSSTIYPTNWKCDILTPLHKSGDKSDPNNYRGLAVSSCLGKLFNKILQRRLDKFCQKNSLINDLQGSGKVGSRTCDHLLVVRCLFDKYVKQQGKYLYTCFVDLRKAFDTVSRVKLFYTLVNDYSIGGKFLKILQQIYTENELYIKLSDGLVKPFNTTVGVKQGCVFSPILFNLFINKICSIFDQTCDPAQLHNKDINCLLWADDLLLISKTPSGLQNSIDKMHQFYQSMGLQVNIKKTKVMIFNKRGIKLENRFQFYLSDEKLEITDEYQYLGIKLKPSGSFSVAVQELKDKASRAWFGISTLIFKNKRMRADRIFSLFDSLVMPVATYGSPLWLPFTIPKKSFENKFDLLSFWETFQGETLNQKCSKMTLSVKKTTPRLAVLGELGRYPMFIQSLAQCINYKLSLYSRKSSNVLIGHALREMESLRDKSCESWLTRVDKIIKILNIPQNLFFNKASGKNVLALLKSRFSVFFLDKINEIKMSDSDQMDHNKLRTYRTLKSSFTREPYIDMIRNRNQRCYLSRLRVGSHNLRVEQGRHTKPITAFADRTCQYCCLRPPLPACGRRGPLGSTFTFTMTSTAARPSPPTDTEFHFLVECPLFSAERSSFYARYELEKSGFQTLSPNEKFKVLLCPTTAICVKLVHRFVKSMFASREKHDEQRRHIQ